MLIVDDNPALRAVVKRIVLRKFRLDIVECNNGLEALERLTHERFALVVLDYEMPVMNGLETLGALRQAPGLSKVPVIMMTGAADDDIVRRILAYGVADFVVKPIRPNELLDRVGRVLKDTGESNPGGARTNAVFEPLSLTPQASVMVADGSLEFRQFFVQQIHQSCRVREADSGLSALRACLEAAPTALFIGVDLGVLGGEALAHKVRTTSGLDAVRVIGMMPSHLLRRARKVAAYDAVILRTFVADLFRDGFEGLLRRSGRMSALLGTVPDLKLVGIAAFEHEVGTALQTAIVPGVAKPGTVAKAACAEVLLSVGTAGLPLALRLVAARKQVARVAARLPQIAPGGPAEAPLVHLLAAVARAIAQELADRSLAVRTGDVTVRPPAAQATADQSDDAIAVDFDAAGLGVTFRLEMSLAQGEPAAAA